LGNYKNHETNREMLQGIEHHSFHAGKYRDTLNFMKGTDILQTAELKKGTVFHEKYSAGIQLYYSGKIIFRKSLKSQMVCFPMIFLFQMWMSQSVYGALLQKHPRPMEFPHPSCSWTNTA